MRQHRALLDDGEQHVGCYCDPDLHLHGVLAGAEEGLDPQMLLDPFELRSDILPTRPCTRRL